MNSGFRPCAPISEIYLRAGKSASQSHAGGRVITYAIVWPGSILAYIGEPSLAQVASIAISMARPLSATVARLDVKKRKRVVTNPCAR